MSLENIMARLAEIPLVVGDQNISGITGTDLQNNPPRSMTPIRILSPLMADNDGMAMRAMSFSGRAGRIDWSIADMCLWTQVRSGRGMESYMLDLTRIADAYVEMNLANRKLGSGITITELKIQMGTSEYPRGTGEAYFVVQAIWDVTEVF